MEEKIKKHPPWKEAVKKILEKFDNEGYGCIITDDEFASYLSIDNSNIHTAEDFKKYSLALLQKYSAIEALLADHNLCLQRTKDGFEILNPSDQITRGYDKRLSKLRKEMRVLQQTITNVNHELLSLEEERDRQLKILKVGMVKMAMNNRKLELPEPQANLVELKRR